MIAWNRCPEKVSKVLAMLLLSTTEDADLRWFGFALSQFDIVSDTRIPTAALTIDTQRIIPRIIVNPQFIEKLTEGQIIAVLMHELWHFLNQTFSRQILRDEEKWNFAVDGVINHNIENDLSSLKKGKDKILLPGDCIRLPPGEFTNPEDIYSEFVYDKLQNKDGQDGYDELQKQFGRFQNGELNLVDDHSLLDNFDNVPEEILKNSIGNVITEASRMAGTTPGGASRILKELFKSVVPWTKLMRDFEGQYMKIGFKSSWKRPNRRFPKLQPGHVTRRGGKLVILIDVSGSTMGDRPRFWGEAYELSKRHETWVVQCDAAVHGKPQRMIRGRMPVEHGGGGTCMNPGLDACKKLGPDMIIVFTDGYLGDRPIDTGVPELWVISTGGAAVQGKRNIFIEEDRNAK